MSSPLDQLLRQAGSGAARPDTRRLLQQALKEKPPLRGWRSQWAWAAGSSLGLVLLAAVALGTTGAADGGWVMSRLPLLGLLALTGQVGAYAALSPRAARYRPWALALAMLSMLALVGLRGDGHPSTTSPWVCTLSHLAVAIPPLWLVVGSLREAAPGRVRWMVAGLFAGTTGAMLGELACERGLAHVALFHLTAWLGIALLCAGLSRILRTRSYAP